MIHTIHLIDIPCPSLHMSEGACIAVSVILNFLLTPRFDMHHHNFQQGLLCSLPSLRCDMHRHNILQGFSLCESCLGVLGYLHHHGAAPTLTVLLINFRRHNLQRLPYSAFIVTFTDIPYVKYVGRGEHRNGNTGARRCATLSSVTVFMRWKQVLLLWSSSASIHSGATASAAATAPVAMTTSTSTTTTTTATGAITLWSPHHYHYLGADRTVFLLYHVRLFYPRPPGPAPPRPFASLPSSHHYLGADWGSCQQSQTVSDFILL